MADAAGEHGGGRGRARDGGALALRTDAMAALWRVMPWVRRGILRACPEGTLRRRVLGEAARRLESELDARRYGRWLELQDRAPDAPLRSAVAERAYRPVVSVVTPVYDIAERWLRRCIESVLSQAYDRWELCLVDDASPSPHVSKVLAEYAARDPRVRTVRLEQNSGIGRATAAAIAMARGEFVGFLDHDDELTPDALLEVVAALQRDPGLDLVYSDEDKLDARGRRVEPFFKPDWSPDLLRSMNYICHFSVVRRSLLEEVGGVRAGFDGAQDWDLLLRVTERTQRIAHVPRVLYHWRKIARSVAAGAAAKPYAYEAARRALEASLDRRGVEARVEMQHAGIFRVRYATRRTPTVSIIVPTRDRVDLLGRCVDGLESRTSYPAREVVVVDNGSTDPASLGYLDGLRARHRVLAYPGAFNWSAINNLAARECSGDLLLFLNNDVEMLEPGWLEAMVEHAQRDEVGAVGAKLLYPDGRIQHAGVVVGVGGVAGHGFTGFPGDSNVYFGFPQITRNVSAVTGACMLVRREVFERVGGFDERLRVAYNDVDFCLKLRQAGYLVVYAPAAVLRHHECATRGAEHPVEDGALMRARWGTALERDPYYSPNLSTRIPYVRLAS